MIKNFFQQRVMSLPYISFFMSHLKYYPTPKNLNFFWSYGSLIGLCLVIQIITGIFLSMHYVPNINYAFISVEHIMRDVQYGFLMRYLHSNGASMLFVLLYVHIFRGLYYSSFRGNLLLWWSGLILFFLMMGTAFLGYVLPWGQMSFWGATVITNLASAIPFVGKNIVEWLWGGFSVDNATLNRFFSLHYLLPFIILAVIVLHLTFLHSKGSTNPLSLNTAGAKINFFPYYYVKDLLAFFVFIGFFSIIVYFFPNMLGHPDNYIPANPMVTPTHIVPEWYFLPFYAILRSIPNKLAGVLAMLGSILILFIFPLFSFNLFRTAEFRYLYKKIFWYFVIVFIFLGWIGQKEAASYYLFFGRLATFLYFFLLICLLYVVPYFENYYIKGVLSNSNNEVFKKD